MQIKYIGPSRPGRRASEGGYTYNFPFDEPVEVAEGFLDLGILENPEFVAVDPEAQAYVPVPPPTKQGVEFWTDGTLRGTDDGDEIPVVTTAAFEAFELGSGLDIWIAAGQSNPDGRAVVDATHTVANAISDDVKCFATVGTYADRIVNAVEPRNNAFGAGYDVEFLKMWLKRVAPNRQGLTVPVAVGSTGFQSGAGRWAVGQNDLAAALVSQARKALAAAGAGARLCGVLWHQGEQDSHSAHAANYQTHLLALIDYVRAQLEAPNLIWLAGQMLPEWIDHGDGIYPGIVDAVHQDLPRLRTNTAFVPLTRGMGFYNGADCVNPGDGVHIGALGCHDLAVGSVAAVPRARANVLGVAPAVPSGLAITQALDALTIAWSAPIARVTDYDLRYRKIGDADWIAVARSANNIQLRASIAAITRGDAYEVQARSKNEQGTSAWSASTSITTVVIPGQATGLAAGTPGSTYMPLTANATTGATYYVWEYKEAASGTWLPAGTSTSPLKQVGGLDPDTSHNFRVSAANPGGVGTPSSVVTASTAELEWFTTAYTGAILGAYGVARKLSSGATQAVDVRRSGDNAIATIGFDAGLLDGAALTAHVGIQSGYITKFYDHHGGTALIPPSTAAQPRIVNAGTIERLNGHPCWVADGTDDYMEHSAPGLYAANGASAFIVGQGVSGGRLISETTAGVGSQFYLPFGVGTSAVVTTATIRNDANTMLLAATNSVGGPIASGTKQMTMIDTGAAIKHRVNGVQAMNAAYTRSGVLTLNRLTIGATNGSTINSFAGYKACEIILSTDDPSAPQLAAAETNQTTFFGISV